MKPNILVVSLVLPVTASATPTGEFIARWDAASRKPKVEGKTAIETMATPEVLALVNEFGVVAGTYRDQILKARAAGQPPRACPPKEVDLTIDAVLAEVRALPVAWRSRDFAESFGAVMDKRYPCAGGSVRS